LDTGSPCQPDSESHQGEEAGAAPAGTVARRPGWTPGRHLNLTQPAVREKKATKPKKTEKEKVAPADQMTRANPTPIGVPSLSDVVGHTVAIST